jgi:peptide/nickel transport system permease protein
LNGGFISGGQAVGAYVIRRLLGLLPVLIGISILVFSFVRLIPGGPAQAMLGERATAEEVLRINKQLGLDQPIYIQYFGWVGNILQGNLGTGVVSNLSVAKELQVRFPATFELAVGAMLFATIIGGFAGVVAAVRRNSLVDNAAMVVAMVGVSMPIFWLAILLIYLFGVNLGWLPTGSRLPQSIIGDFQSITGFHVLDGILSGRGDIFIGALRHLVLPSVALGTIPMAIIARMTRSTMVEVLSQDYVRTARAKGLAGRVVVYKHALRNALLPVVTVVGLSFGALLGGAVITETVFSWQGIGSWIVEGINNRDYPIVQGGVLLVALVFVLVNLLVDLSYAVLDPRIQYR